MERPYRPYQYSHGGEIHTDTSPEYLTAIGMSHQNMMDMPRWEEEYYDSIKQYERDWRNEEIQQYDYLFLSDVGGEVDKKVIEYRQSLREYCNDPDFPKCGRPSLSYGV